jgi:trans-aconitate methyltransferase
VSAEHSEEWRVYRAYHARRYAALVETVRELAPAPERILDVGAFFQTELLREAFPQATVDTLGFRAPGFEGERHFELDLNDVADAEPGAGEHDVVVMAEVIEHLHTAPQLVLRHLASYLKPGAPLIVQTPNAVALHKRLRMLAGSNPVEPIRTTDDNPGHFHEYTLGELRAAAGDAGLTVGGVRAANYFGTNRAYAALGRVLPPSMRHGITIWMTR